MSWDFRLLVFFLESVSPQAPEYTIRAVSKFFENLRRYLQLKVHHRCCWLWWQMQKIFNHNSFNYLVWTPLGSRVNYWIHFCLQVHFKVWYCSQYLPPVQICRRCHWYRWQIPTGVVDTGGKFAASIIDTGGKFATGINNTSETSGKIFRQCRWKWWQICHQCRWHWWKICHWCRWYQWCTLTCEYFRKFLKKFETVLMGYSGAGGKLIHEKNEKQKFLWHCPFKGAHAWDIRDWIIYAERSHWGRWLRDWSNNPFLEIFMHIFGKNCLATTQPSAKIICHRLSYRKELFPVGWAIGKNCFPQAESLAKIARHTHSACFVAGWLIFTILRDDWKSHWQNYWVIVLSLRLKTKIHRNLDKNKSIFWFSPQATNPDGITYRKNASSKFSRLATFKRSVNIKVLPITHLTKKDVAFRRMAESLQRRN